MVVPCLSEAEFFELLKKNGWTVCSNEHWSDFGRVVVEKDGLTVPIQLLTKYFYPHVVNICHELNITPTENHLKVYEQHYRRKKKSLISLSFFSQAGYTNISLP